MSMHTHMSLNRLSRLGRLCKVRNLGDLQMGENLDPMCSFSGPTPRFIHLTATCAIVGLQGIKAGLVR